MKYYISFLLLTWSTLATGQSSDMQPLFLNSSHHNEPYALLEPPAKVDPGDREAFQIKQRSLGCDAQVFLTDTPIPPGNYEASHQVIATGVVQNGTVTMRAANEVILDSDASGAFEVKAGATLEVTMGACTL